MIFFVGKTCVEVTEFNRLFQMSEDPSDICSILEVVAAS